MSGALAQHRTPSRPAEDQKFDFYNWQPVFDRVLRPGGVYQNGRCVEWRVEYVPHMLHVLDYRPEPHRPSKHARGRMRARTAKEQRRIRAQQARVTQIMKTMTVNIRAGAVYDEV